MPTTRNARGIDIVAYDQLGETFIGIQVKALSKRNPVPLGTSIERLMGDFWVIVNDVVRAPTAFIFLPEEIQTLAHRGEREGRISYWLQPSVYDAEPYREAWGRIGSGFVGI